MKGCIPRREPRIFPFVRHGEHVRAVQVLPPVISSFFSFRRRRRKGRITCEPSVHAIVVRLLRPDQPRECLSLYLAGILAHFSRSISRIELVGLRHARPEYLIECRPEGRLRSRRSWVLIGEAQPNRRRSSRGYIEAIKRPGLGSCLRGVYSAFISADQIFVKRIFQVLGSVLHSEKPPEVRLVIRKQ